MSVVQESWVLLTLERNEGAFPLFNGNEESRFPEKPELTFEKLGGVKMKE